MCALLCMALIVKPARGAGEPAPTLTDSVAITIGFTPGEESSGLKERTDAFVRLLAERTGLHLKSYVGTSYSDLIDKMAERKVDFAFLSASSFVEAEARCGAKVLLKKVWEGPFYYSVLLVPAKSTIRSIKELKKKRIAFVDEKSASGYLYPLVAFRHAGLSEKTDFASITFSGGHDRSVQLLKKGAVDAIAVFSNDKAGVQTAWTQHGGQARDVRVLWSSAPIPNDPFVVRRDFYEKSPKIAHEVMFGLIEMNEDPAEMATVRKLLGIQSLMLATSQQYEPVREMVRLLRDAKGEGK
ncbi:MAG: phosphate/phosphite/phosphonate ABC transporter substrate-binding protein [Bdellovibrionales bacterium]|nr:phosphate/phosphite/phosphonate ABC transporter substrate-binding protein [Bdellovibrionales bacterium]